jgi:uncharacterized protein YggT (Ycf19 family)
MDRLFYYVFTFLYFYQYALFIFILLSWLPAVKDTMFYKLLGSICEPFFRIFRGWLVFGNFDLTPMFGIILYGMLLQFVINNIS